MKKYKSRFQESKDMLPKMFAEVISIDEYQIYIYYDHDSLSVINEAKDKGAISLGNPYSVNKHSPHTSENEYHLHIYDKEKQIGAINKSGSTHDSFHGVQLPRKVTKKLKQIFPDFNIPDDGFLESAEKINPLIYFYNEHIEKLYENIRGKK